MDKLLRITGLALSMGVAAWTGHAGAQFLSSTGPVIAILDGELLVGEATGHLGGWGTIALHSRAKAGRTCVGEFSYLKLPAGKELRGEGNNLELVAAVPFPPR